MGNANSTTPKDNVEEKSQEAKKDALNARVDKLIKKFVKGIDTYKTNDLREVKKFIDTYEDDLPSSVNKKEILEMITTVEKSLVNVPDDKSVINSDKGLYDHFYNVNASSTQKLRDDFLSDPLVSKNNMADSVNKMFDPYTKLRSEVMFYRYKYIQINVILIIVIEQFQNIFDTSISAIAAEYLLQIEETYNLLKRFIDLANNLASHNELQLQIEDGLKETIHKLAGNAYEKLEKQISEMPEKLKQINGNTPQLLAQMLLDTNQIALEKLSVKQTNTTP